MSVQIHIGDCLDVLPTLAADAPLFADVVIV